MRAQLPRYVIHRRLFFRSDNIRKRRVFMVTLALTITEAWVFVIALTEAGKHYVSELRYGYSGLLISIHFIAMIQGLISVLGVWEASPARSMLLPMATSSATPSMLMDTSHSLLATRHHLPCSQYSQACTSSGSCLSGQRARLCDRTGSVSVPRHMYTLRYIR